ncbi:MAG: hypothetical protein ACK4LQ_02205 [Pararhodobacter sp.]
MTGSDLRRRVHFAALAVALSARSGQLEASDVEATANLARRLLPEDCRTRAQVEQFATRYAECRRQPAAVVELGGELLDALERLARTDPPGMERADIHG